MLESLLAATCCRKAQRPRLHSSSLVPTVEARPVTQRNPERNACRATRAAALPAAFPVPWSKVATRIFRRARAGSRAAAARRTMESRPPDTASTACAQSPRAEPTTVSTCDASTPATVMIVLIYLFTGEFRLETHGPLGTLWVSFGLIAFYIALIWLNSLLGMFLTPLFIVPGTWLLDWMKRRKRQQSAVETGETGYQG